MHEALTILILLHLHLYLLAQLLLQHYLLLLVSSELLDLLDQLLRVDLFCVMDFLSLTINYLIIMVLGTCQRLLLLGCGAIHSLLLLLLIQLAELLLWVLQIISAVPIDFALFGLRLWWLAWRSMLLIQELLEVGEVLDIIQVYVLDLPVLSWYDLAVFQKLMLIDLQNLALLRQNYLYYLILRRAGIFSSLSLWCGHHSILLIIWLNLMQILLCCLLLHVLHEEALSEIWPLWLVDLAQFMLIFIWLMSHEQISIFIAFDHDSAICLSHSY